MAENMRLEYLDPEQLKDNPLNWRTHPDRQTRLLSDVIGEVGWAGAALLNERTGNLIDGHLRKKTAIKRGEKIPVLIGDWSPEDERKILMTLDPIAALAETDQTTLDELIAGIETESDLVRELMEESQVPDFVLPDDNQDIDENSMMNTENECPKCGFKW